MEAVVTLDPQFIDAWSTAGWHWAYNIYADIPTNPDYEKRGPMAIRKAQENAVATGLDYLDRGSNLNPDTYRLWFEYGWTRAEKAGYYDEKTVELYKTARSKSDAREIEVSGKGGQMIKEKGLDILGRTIGHLWERVPEFDKAQSQYADDLMGATPQQRKMLDKLATPGTATAAITSPSLTFIKMATPLLKVRSRLWCPTSNRSLPATKCASRSRDKLAKISPSALMLPLRRAICPPGA